MFLCVSMAVYMRQSRYRSQRINLGYLSLSSTLIESVSLLFAWHFWGFFCLYISSCVGTLRLQTILGIIMPSSTWVVGIGIYILTLAWQAFYPMCQHPHTLFPTWLQSFLSPVFPRLPFLLSFSSFWWEPVCVYSQPILVPGIPTVIGETNYPCCSPRYKWCLSSAKNHFLLFYFNQLGFLS